MHWFSMQGFSWRRISIIPATRALVVASVTGLLLVSCSQVDGLEYEFPKTRNERERAKVFGNTSVFGGSGLSLFGGDEEGAGGAASPIPVNSFLWRATLDTLSFMPLASADPFGGVIITDWFAPPESADERFKMTVYILSRSLRSDGLKVAVFRQIRDEAGTWIDGEVTEGTARRLEDGILTRARELRVAGLAQ